MTKHSAQPERETIAHLTAHAEARMGDRVHAHVPNGDAFLPVRASDSAVARREVSAALLTRGVKKGDRVGIIADTRIEWTVADLAIASIGAVTVGVYPASTPAQMQYVIEHARCVALFVGGTGPANALASVRAALPAVRFVVDFDAAPAALGADAWDALRAEGRAALAQGTVDLASVRDAVAPDDIASVVYTSGTTGNPKGVVLTHRALFAASRVGIESLAVTEHDVGVGFLPLAHALARVNFYGTLHAGNTVWFSKSLETVADVWRVAHPTVLALVPRVLEKIRGRVLAAVAASPARRRALFARALEVGTARARLVDQGQPVPRALAIEHALWERLIFRRVRAGIGWGRLRFALSGGAPLRRDVAEFFAAIGVLVLEGYGLSETSAATVVSVPGASRIGAVGRPLPGVELRLDDDGEILLRCPGLFAGYESDDAATRAAFTDDGFFRTGDVGVLDAGFLRITDRKKDLLVTAGGKNVAPQNLEGELLKDDRLLQAIVLGEGRPYLIALLVVDPQVADPQRAAAEAVARANSVLARFEQVKRFALLDAELTVDSGLLTPTQKVRRRAVAERYAATVERLYADGAAPAAPPDVTG